MREDSWVRRLVRYQYVEELLDRRRVLEIGCGSGSGADFLAERAEHVVALDTSSALLAQARGAYRRRNLEFVIGEPDRLQHSDDSFDVVLVPELERWVTRGTLMPELRRVLRPDGIALFAVPAEEQPHGMDYSDLLEYLSHSFGHVRVLGEIPFRGTIMADFEPEEELEPALDCSLIEEDDPPGFYTALCADVEVASLGYSVIQYQPPPGAADRSAELEAELQRLRKEVALARAGAERNTRELKAAAGRAAREDNRRIAELQERLDEVEGARHAEQQRLSRVEELQQERDELAARLDELDDLRERRHELENEVAELNRRLADAERRVLESSSEARHELTSTRRELREREQDLTRVSEELKSTAAALRRSARYSALRRGSAARDVAARPGPLQ